MRLVASIAVLGLGAAVAYGAISAARVAPSERADIAFAELPAPGPAPVVPRGAAPVDTGGASAHAEAEDTGPTRGGGPGPTVAAADATADSGRARARTLQAALKKAGCYAGAATGDWTPSSRRAMSGFLDAINASLPVDEPDAVLVALVAANPAATCAVATAAHDASPPPAAVAERRKPARVVARDERGPPQSWSRRVMDSQSLFEKVFGGG